MIVNLHERALPGTTPSAAGALIDTLADGRDAAALWPATRWPVLRLDPGLVVGARGGHGPIRYEVSDYEPGRRACFRFDRRIFDGHHWFEVTTVEGETVLRHVLVGRPRGRMRLLWPLAIRWLHDALVEDGLDRAAATLAGREWQPRRLGRWVRLTRQAAARLR